MTRQEFANLPGCRKHGGELPCKECIKEQIPKLEIENQERIKQGRKDLHDIENLKRCII